MKISAYLLVFDTASILSFSVFATEAIERDNDLILLSSCQALIMTPEQDNAKSCFYFIRGFLAAAQAIDPPATKNQGKEKESRKLYPFMSRRPYRSREKIPSTRFFPFCIPDDEPEARVIRIVSKQLSSRTDTTRMLRDIIFKTLKTEYPCEKA